MLDTDVAPEDRAKLVQGQGAVGSMAKGPDAAGEPIVPLRTR